MQLYTPLYRFLSKSYIPERLNYTRIAKEDDLVAVHLETANYRTDAIECLTPKNPKKFADLFREIHNCWNKKEIGYQYRCNAILYQILFECCSEHGQDNIRDSRIRKSIEYLSENYRKKDLTVSEIARKSYVSEVYFRKLFKEEFGISPQKHIVRLRIQNAKSLISTGYFSLKEVADRSGYSDYKYFSVEFKKHVGVSPLGIQTQVRHPRTV